MGDKIVSPPLLSLLHLDPTFWHKLAKNQEEKGCGGKLFTCYTFRIIFLPVDSLVWIFAIGGTRVDLCTMVL